MKTTFEELANDRQAKRADMVLVGKVFSETEDGPFDYENPFGRAWERRSREYLRYRLKDRVEALVGYKGIDLRAYEVPVDIPDKYLVVVCVKKTSKWYDVLTKNMGFVQMTKTRE